MDFHNRKTFERYRFQMLRMLFIHPIHFRNFRKFYSSKEEENLVNKKKTIYTLITISIQHCLNKSESAIQVNICAITILSTHLGKRFLYHWIADLGFWGLISSICAYTALTDAYVHIQWNIIRYVQHSQEKSFIIIKVECLLVNGHQWL